MNGDTESIEGFEILTHTYRGPKRLEAINKFAETLSRINDGISFRLSTRGWCYQLEGFNLIDKGQFDRVETVINECRKNGLLPYDFVAVDESREFTGIMIPDTESPAEYMKGYLEYILHCESGYTPDYWEGEKYYIQMAVEKIDLKTLFEPVCKEYNIPIANAKGWSSILMRADFCKRFKKAEEKGLKCVLLYCGDFDPAGLQISKTIRDNLDQIKNGYWNDKTPGHDPENLIIDRFGLNYDFIQTNQLTWIDNLKTGSGKDLSNPTHKDHSKPYVQDYLKKYGARKCEANALVVNPAAAERLCRESIEHYFGVDALRRFEDKRRVKDESFKEFREKTGLEKIIKEVIHRI